MIAGVRCGLVLFGGAVLLALAGCDPPGRPEQPEPLAQNITDFHTLYGQNCSGCHGLDGKNGPGRILNDPLYLAVMPKETLHQILVYGRAGTAMPAWAKSEGGPLEPKQIDALVNGIYQSWAKPVDLHGAELPSYSADVQKGSADAGRKLFARNCFMCHGPGARVGSVTAPAYLSLVSNQMLRTSIIVGRPDLGMPDYRNLKLGRALSSEDINDLVAFLASKRPANAPAALGSINTENETTMRGGQANPNVNDSGSGQSGATARGDEGSGNGPGSSRKASDEGNKPKGNSSQRGIK